MAERSTVISMTTLPVTVANFSDGRDSKEVIGENREDNPRPVTTTGDVRAFVSTCVRQLLNEAHQNRGQQRRRNYQGRRNEVFRSRRRDLQIRGRNSSDGNRSGRQILWSGLAYA
jgi:hypothetical protein